jgi:hypothetical protein
MQRNQAKKLVLQGLEDLRVPSSAGIVATWLGLEYNISISDRACSMELLRCHRQGLLRRSQGRYTLTERGEQRLRWLRNSA